MRCVLIKSLSVLALLVLCSPARAADPTFEITADRSAVSFPSDTRLEYRIRITNGADDEVIPLSVGAGGEQGRLEGALQGETLRVLDREVRLDGPGTLRQGSSTHGDPCTGPFHVPLPRAFSGAIGQSYSQIVELPAHTQTTLVVPAGVTHYAPWPDTRHRISVFRELYGGTLQEGGPLPVPELKPAGRRGVRVTLQTTPDTTLKPCGAPIEVSTNRAIGLTGTTDPPIPGQLLDVVVVEPGTTAARVSERVRVADDGSYSAAYTPLREGDHGLAVHYRAQQDGLADDFSIAHAFRAFPGPPVPDGAEEKPAASPIATVSRKGRFVRGRVRLELRCVPRCLGRVVLSHRSRRLGSRRFDVRGAAAVRIRIDARTRRALRRGALRMTAEVRPDGAAGRRFVVRVGGSRTAL